jgi:hypothetical protein
LKWQLLLTMRNTDNCLQLRPLALRLRFQSQAPRPQRFLQQGLPHRALPTERCPTEHCNLPPPPSTPSRTRNLAPILLTLWQIIVPSKRALSPQKDAHVAMDQPETQYNRDEHQTNQDLHEAVTLTLTCHRSYAASTSPRHILYAQAPSHRLSRLVLLHRVPSGLRRSTKSTWAVEPILCPRIRPTLSSGSVITRGTGTAISWEPATWLSASHSSVDASLLLAIIATRKWCYAHVDYYARHMKPPQSRVVTSNYGLSLRAAL